MKTIKKDEQVTIERIFYNLKAGTENKDKLLSELGAIVGKIFKKTFKVVIIPEKEQKKSFVMSVVPDSSTVDKIMKSVVNNETKLETIKSLWKKCNS